MNDERIVYVRRVDGWQKIDFKDIAIGEDFILCESDGTPVGHYVAISTPYFNEDGIGTIRNVEVIAQ